MEWKRNHRLGNTKNNLNTYIARISSRRSQLLFKWLQMGQLSLADRVRWTIAGITGLGMYALIIYVGYFTIIREWLQSYPNYGWNLCILGVIGFVFGMIAGVYGIAYIETKLESMRAKRKHGQYYH